MGDRANVAVHVKHGSKINEPGACVVFYTHWRGSETPSAVAGALRACKGDGRDQNRWRDAPYLARVVFDWILNGDGGTSGFGIDTDMGDNEHPLLVVDPAEQKVLMYHRSGAEGGRVLNCPAETVTVPVREWTFEEFAKMGEDKDFGWDAIDPE